MRNRAKRNKWLMRQPVTLAFQLLLARQRTARTARVQLVLASATLSKRTMRDMSTIVRPRLHSRTEPDAALSPAHEPSPGRTRPSRLPPTFRPAHPPPSSLPTPPADPARCARWRAGSGWPLRARSCPRGGAASR